MRIPSLMIVLAACACSPDPRHRTLENVQRDGRGGWVVLARAGKPALEGELIALGDDVLDVLDHDQLIRVPRVEIASLEVWAWPTSPGAVGVYGGLGTISTISNGVFLVFTAPAWLVTTAITAVHESRASLYRYPGDSWNRLAIWARFPQGLPAGVDAHQLIGEPRGVSGF